LEQRIIGLLQQYDFVALCKFRFTVIEVLTIHLAHVYLLKYDLRPTFWN